MNLTFYILLVISAYFVGSIPFGLVYASMRGVDIRKVGSGNIGATNVSRQFGFLGGFVPVFMLDFFKGAYPLIIIRIFGVQIEGLNTDIAMIIAGFVAAIGHIFPVFLKFKGGKGVATFAGFYFLLAPLIALYSLSIFIVCLFIFRILDIIAGKEYQNASFGKLVFKNLTKRLGFASIFAIAAIPIMVYFLEPARLAVMIFGIVVTILIIYSHRSNIAKLFTGEK